MISRATMGVVLTDEHGRVLGAHIDERSGEVMFMCPSGKPGIVRRLSQVPREEARDFARHILAVVGEDDQ